MCQNSLKFGRITIEKQARLCYDTNRKTASSLLWYREEVVGMAVDNIQYKDRLFNFLFGTEENKAWTLSLYNAVNGSSYTDPAEIEITTIKEVMYLGMHNDVSFLISNEMDLYEQQSTYNPNMPVRLLQYAGNLYEKYINQTGMNKFGDTLIKLPVPRLIVFYNGTRNEPDQKILRLSDAFPEGAESDIEVTVRMLNVNYGRNQELLDACKPLAEYAWIVNEVREKNLTKDEEGASSAIDQAISSMPDDFVIKPFLVAHRAEVKGMLLTEYNEAEAMEKFEQDGDRKRAIKDIQSLMETLKLTAKQAMDALKIPVSEQSKYMNML